MCRNSASRRMNSSVQQRPSTLFRLGNLGLLSGCMLHSQILRIVARMY
jgi:hypothetical protein